jgi:hypothetical protein
VFQGNGPFNRMSTNQGGREYPTPGTVANVGPSNYDVYYIYVKGSRAGWRAQWNDPVAGIMQEWVSGGWFGTSATYYVNTIAGTGVSNVGGSSYDRIVGPEEVRVPDCKGETPQKPISNKPELAYRQVFNSPETSFGQPFLGNVLKIENVMFGKGLAHFVQVKGNANYKLLTEEAQRDALYASQIVGDITVGFSATAMFTTYQAYLTIYINGITRRNFAYSYNSIADYNYNVGVGNDITVGNVRGIKQRMLDITRYLIPGVQSLGDTITVGGVVKNAPINNYRRESSVYLKTAEVGWDGTTPVSPLPFPSNSPSMIVGGVPIVTEKSRLTIGGTSVCATPTKEQDISVVSYYASLKNIVPNQWGQIYTYTTVDTGFQLMMIK